MNPTRYAERDSKHLTSPLGDVRNRSVLCRVCGVPCWNVCQHCDRHCPHDDPKPVVTSPGSDPAPVLLGWV